MSAYLDDIEAPAGSKVRCVANIAAKDFTVGREYTVLPNCEVRNDTGVICIPSARFELKMV